jgi:hypothetical protein
MITLKKFFYIDAKKTVKTKAQAIFDRLGFIKKVSKF